MNDSFGDDGSARQARPTSDSGEVASFSTEFAQTLEITPLEMIVSGVLRVGVVLSLTITSAGLVLLFLIDPSNAVVHQTGPLVFHNPLVILADALLLRPKAVIDAGLILLILTPIVRVAVTVVAFVVDGDVVYTVITLFVLAVLVASFFLGQVG